MSPDIFFVIAFLIPIVLAIGLKINASILFMSMCVGAVLVEFSGGRVYSLAGSLNGNFTQSTFNLALFILPPILTAAFMVHSLHGTRAILNILPAIATGILTVFLIQPLLPIGLRKTVAETGLWHQLSGFEGWIIAGSSIVSLIFVWFQRHPREHRPHHRNRKSSI